MDGQITREEILKLAAQNEKIFIMNHPVVAHKISSIRDERTGTKECRELVREVTEMMTYEATRSVPTEEVALSTPVGETVAPFLSGKKPVFVEILRAGQIMVEGALQLVPTAKVGAIGEYRHPETHNPVSYFCKIPHTSIAERQYYLMDPMLATGGSAIEAVNQIKDKGGKDIIFLCIFAAPEGLRRLMQVHPDIRIFVGVIDEYLTDNDFIFPGMGDAGDRLFGTV